MVDGEFIRKKHLVEGWSIRKVSRQLEVARQTARKALVSAEVPRYRLRTPRPAPVMDPYRAVIMQWLAADAAAPPKQRHTAKRIYDRLVAAYGFTGAEPTVRRCVARLRPQHREAFVPLTADWGKSAPEPPNRVNSSHPRAAGQREHPCTGRAQFQELTQSRSCVARHRHTVYLCRTAVRPWGGLSVRATKPRARG